MDANGEIDSAAVQAHRFSSRPNRYLSSLQFGWVRDRFLRLKGNKSNSSKVNFLMFAVPVTLGALFGAIHYLQTSFAVYLKYQALVDAYYVKTHPVKQIMAVEEVVPDTKLELAKEEREEK